MTSLSLAHEYFSLLLMVVAAVVIAGLMIFLTSVLGPKRPNPQKREPFECGNPSTGSPRQRLNVKFYGVALLFLVFDVETIFLLPWAALYRELGIFGLVEMSIFLGFLGAGLAYAWRAGALEW